MSDLEQTIHDNAKAPARAQGDSGSVQQHPLRDQIEAARFLASTDAVKKGLGIKLTRIVPPGTV